MKAWCDDSTCKYNCAGIVCGKDKIEMERMTFGAKVYVVCKDYEKVENEDG